MVALYIGKGCVMERSVEKKLTEFLVAEIGGSYKNVVEVALSDIMDVIELEFNVFTDDTLVLMRVKDTISTGVSFVYNYSEELLYTCFETPENVKKDHDFEGIVAPSYSRIKFPVPLYALGYVLPERIKTHMFR